MSVIKKSVIKRAVVLGAGLMGRGIAQVLAENKISVHLIDVSPRALKTAREFINFSLKKRFVSHAIADQPKEVLKNMRFTGQLSALKTAQLAVEAVPEDFQLKQKLLRKISKTAPAKAIIASNTSSISITKLAALVRRPERVCGLHFMNPAPLMPLVEVIRAKQTSDKVFKQLLRLAAFLGKTPVAAQDHPGFVVNRILMPMINEAIKALQAKTAPAQDIDQAMCLGCGHPMGPLALADLIGLDTCLAIMKVLEKGLGPYYTPCALLKKYVSQGRLGKKTGRGFYTY